MLLEWLNHECTLLGLQTVVRESYGVNWKLVSLHGFCYSNGRFIEQLHIAVIKMVWLLMLRISDKHACFWVNFKIFARFEVRESRVLNIATLNVIVFESALTLVEFPKVFLSFLSEVKSWVLIIFFMKWHKFYAWEISSWYSCAGSLHIKSIESSIVVSKIFRR